MKTFFWSGFIGLTLCLVSGCDQGQVKISTPPPDKTDVPKTAAPSNAPAAPVALPAPTNPPVAPPVPTADDATAVALIKTSAGDMVIEFWPDVAPETVKNFKKLASSGFYDGTCFHRIMKDFMIQGGDPWSKDPSKEAMWGGGDPGYKIKAEFNSKLHDRGVISMARSADPDSAGSQFFICTGDANSPNLQYLNGKYTGFGKLIKGDDVLQKITNTPVTTGASGEPSKPTVRVDVVSIKIVKRDSVK